mgnify:CR=1 FL=1
MESNRKLQKEIQKILDRYDLGEYKSHNHFSYALTNTVYKLKTNKETLIIKLFEHENKRVIALQTKIMDLLAKEGLSSKLFKTKQGKFVYYYKNH